MLIGLGVNRLPGWFNWDNELLTVISMLFDVAADKNGYDKRYEDEKSSRYVCIVAAGSAQK